VNGERGLIPFPPENPPFSSDELRNRCECAFAWVLTRTNHSLILVIFSVSSVWWNGVVSSCNAPPAGNHLQIFFTRAQDQSRKKNFTPDHLPIAVTRDPDNMIRVLMSNGAHGFGFTGIGFLS
jgi:hypothetical protein